MPRGVIHYGKTQVSKSDTQHSLHITVSNQQHNSWADLLQASLSSQVKSLVKTDIKLRQALPTDLFTSSESVREYKQRLQKVFECLSSDEMVKKALWKWQSRFMQRR